MLYNKNKRFCNMTGSLRKGMLLLLVIANVSSIPTRHNLKHEASYSDSPPDTGSSTSNYNLISNRKDQHHHQQLIQEHNYWFNKNHPTDSILSSQRQWNYCDYKCLYLQKYNSNKDFVVVVMGGLFKEDFSACYVKNGQDYTLWKDIMTNKFYEQNCGQDYKDWMKSEQFNVKGIYGVGIGTVLNQSQIYK